MRLILATLFSRKDNAGGLVLLDPDSATLCPARIMDMTGMPVRHRHLRGVHWSGRRLHVVTSCAMFVFTLDTKAANLFALEQTVILPEWVLGPTFQANLHTVFATSSAESVLVPFNTLCALDQLDVQGKLVLRRFYWEIAPDLFPPPPTAALKRSFCFGLVRHIFQDPSHGPVLVMSRLNNEDTGALIALNSGKTLLRMNYNPHGAVLDGAHLFVSNIQAGEILVYPWPVNNAETPAMRRIVPDLDHAQWPDSVQYTRGMTICGPSLVYGVCHPSKVAPRQIAPRLVEYDLKSKTQVREFFLPPLEGLDQAQVYALQTVPDEIADDAEAWFCSSSKHYPLSRTAPGPIAQIKQHSVMDNLEESVIENRTEPCREPNTVTLPEVRTPQGDRNQPNIRASGLSQADQRPACLVFDDVGLFFPRKRRTWFFRDMRRRPVESFWALRNVSFALHEGETIALIGRNGSGKSTLSMLCCGVYQPDEGRVEVHGRTQLLALGVGFKPELSGRDNVFVSASLLGLSRAQTRDLLPDIEAFAELGEFMDQPVRTYSSGMKSRLGFAVATAVDPEILVLDETMSVGDKAFQTKAAARMCAMREKAKSVLLVSHSPEQIKKLCSRALWLEQGRLFMDDEPGKVLHAYDNFCKNPQKWLEQHGEQI